MNQVCTVYSLWEPEISPSAPQTGHAGHAGHAGHSVAAESWTWTLEVGLLGLG